jgi:sigma-E factor negative regulatory protein RseA
MMKQHISALMDGELYDDEAETLLDRMKRSSNGNEEWGAYHLIGDVLRQPENVRVGSCEALYERLRAEPTILAPRRRTAQNARWYAVSAAASVGALALVSWLSVQIGQEPVQQQTAMLQPAPAASSIQPARLPASNINNYLMAHQEFSPSAGMQDAAYARIAAGQR